MQTAGESGILKLISYRIRKVLSPVEKIILSLKNIYRLLVYNDFPIYSDRVISKKQKKGQTLLRFWQDTMLQDFCALPNPRK